MKPRLLFRRNTFVRPGSFRYRLRMVRWGYHCHGLGFALRVFRDYGRSR